MKRERLDKRLVDDGLVASRERARALIMAGAVRIGDRVVDKPGALIAADAALQVTGADIPYVSRGGVKLAGALDALALDVAGRLVLDVGASTGGFSDCVLQRGARAVIAVDVGYGQLAWSLRQDPRLTLIERCNVRHLAAAQLPAVPDLAVVDVSFISLELVLPKLLELLPPGALIVALVKPQFEVGKGQVGGGGVVRDPVQHAAVLARIREVAARLGFTVVGECESPIQGPKGNREFFLALRCPAAGQA
ncbi:MAG: TlyA family RNA methyltransferase [Deltaproteobacteria bacterium]|nr:TlyA family RNA methyltransferase [Deltaproteobacteria bacterium]